VLPGAHGGVSLEVGSFGTQRLTVDGQFLDGARGLYGRVDGFVDRARNDFGVDVEVTAADGGLVRAKLPLAHDRYGAGGGAIELGVIDQPWAARLMLRGFVSGYDKQFPSDAGMDRPYGGVESGERSAGAHGRYQQPLGGGVALDAMAGYVFTRDTFLDASTCQYDWYGDCFMHNQPGEIEDNKPRDQVTWSHAAFARLGLSWRVAPGHTLALSSAPTYTTRTGHERLDAGLTRDPLAGERWLATVVTGLEYQLDLLGDRLENIAFVKHYAQRLSSDDPLPGGEFSHTGSRLQHPGVGDGLRYRFAEWLYAKASYEWATRLPRPVEAFGDGAFIDANPAIEPESSHNLNLGVTVDGLRTPAGRFTATATGFLRDAKNLITLFGAERQSYQNVFGARALGVDAAVVWASPGDLVSVDGSATYQDLRNDSPGGEFGAFNGVRLPNRPYLFGAMSARLTLRDLVRPRDQLVVSAGTRYVHSFYRSWENVGLAASKQVIPSQLAHTVGVGYLVRGDRVTVSTTLEVSNLTDEAVFDYYGLQRPGRAIAIKTALDF
jgi:vitamin B12 transporter